MKLAGKPSSAVVTFVFIIIVIVIVIVIIILIVIIIIFIVILMVLMIMMIQDLLLQYIGVLTIALFGIFLALLLPVIGKIG